MSVRERGSDTRAVMENYLTEHHITPPISMEMPSNDTIKQAVIAGMGLAFLSLHSIGQEVRAGALVVEAALRRHGSRGGRSNSETRIRDGVAMATIED